MNNRGFTLVELAVALVIGGFLVGVVFQFVNGHQRFVGMQSAREEVQQNGRAALELISAELRGASRGGIVAATAGSIRFRSPRIWGIVCGPEVSGTRVVVFPGVDLTPFKGSNLPDSLALRESPAAPPVQWRFASVTDATPAAGQGAAQCGVIDPQPGRVQVRTLTNVPTTIPFQLGEPAYLYDIVEYATGNSNVPGKWLLRTAGGPAQPLAGPLKEVESVPVFRLRYFDAGGTVLDPIVVANIAEVEVKVTTISRSSKPSLEFSDSTRVRLRN
ncbi:MAG TPA: prepilin-type N-terminal cleavage/methylation domain-containing protein [Longimicrobiaceae bacterium]|nr:prepilin-type N-terminal cleavage/methylation domain-containing protein [Longimicrobiaceae bacterium]